MIKFEKSNVDGYFTNVVLSLPDDKLDSIIAKLAPDLAPAPQPSWGFVCAEVKVGQDWGTLVVELDARRCFIEVFNHPEGDDILDGAHPHYSEPRPTLWIDLVQPLKAIFNGQLPRSARHFTGEYAN